jgi:hypothetical protein
MFKYLFLILSISVFASGNKLHYECHSIDSKGLEFQITARTRNGEVSQVKVDTDKYIEIDQFEKMDFNPMDRM